MNTIVVKVKTVRNLQLNDDEFVEDCMAALLEQHPQIKGYMYERISDEHIQIMMWGDIDADD